jgi:hypothetical protein
VQVACHCFRIACLKEADDRCCDEGGRDNFKLDRLQSGVLTKIEFMMYNEKELVRSNLWLGLMTLDTRSTASAILAIWNTKCSFDAAIRRQSEM